MAIIHVSSADAGAPQPSKDFGDISAIMKWALPQLGWTLEFESANSQIVAFKMDSGVFTGYIQFDHSLDDDVCYVKLYSSMTGINAGSGESGDAYWQCAYTGSDYPWEIRGDEASFLFLAYPYTTQQTSHGHNVMYAGLLNPISAVDNTFCAIGFTGSSWTSTCWNGRLYGYMRTTFNGARFLWDVANTSNNFGGGALNSHPFMTNQSHGLGGEGPYLVGGDSFVSPILFYDDNSVPRGYLRGVMGPWGDWMTKFTHEDTIADVPMPNGTTKNLIFRRIRDQKYTAGGRGSILLDTSTDWGWF